MWLKQIHSLKHIWFLPTSHNVCDRHKCNEMWGKEQNEEYDKSQEGKTRTVLARPTHQLVIESSYCSWRLEKRGRGSDRGTGRKGGRAEGAVVVDGGKREKGRAMAWKEEGKRWEGGYEVCTRLSAPGVPCGPGSSVRKGWGGGRRKRMERRRRRGRGQGPCLHLKLSNEIYNKMRPFAARGSSNLTSLKKIISTPPPFSWFKFRQTDWNKAWWVVWPDEMRSRGSQTVEQEVMRVRLETDRMERCDYYRNDFVLVQPPSLFSSFHL